MATTKIIRIMNVVYDDYQSKANILALFKTTNSASSEIVIFDKTSVGWVRDFLFTNNCISSKVEVITMNANSNLLDTVVEWSKIRCLSKSQWVQVLAEDDAFLMIQEEVSYENSYVTMYLCPMVYLYKDKLLLENQVNFEKKINANNINEAFKKNQTVGDSSWHALIRGDVFAIYCEWTTLLPIVLWSVSNQAVWTALHFGAIDKLRSFVFCKDSDKWSVSNQAKFLMEKQYTDNFGRADLYVWDAKLYYLSCVINLMWLQVNYPVATSNRLIVKALDLLSYRPSIRGLFEFKWQSELYNE
ncbi:MAG: hypothetical protein RIR02_418, partial [Pseudomonadota bacterium]